MKLTTAVSALSALAQESRLNAFRLLVKRGPEGIQAGVLSDKLQIPAATLSFHLSQLKKTGLIKDRREGRAIFYSADYARIDQLLGFLSEQCSAEIGKHNGSRNGNGNGNGKRNGHVPAVVTSAKRKTRSR